MEFAYISALLFSLTGMAIIDWRYKLAYWHNRKRTVVTLLLCVGIFVIWDILGIALGIFFHGGSPYTLSLRLFPEFPIEELFFLTLLCYTALIMYLGGTKLWRRT